MPYKGWLAMGGNEVLNNERIRSVGLTYSCPMGWLKGERCTTLEDALYAQAVTSGEPAPLPYAYANIEDQPWYDQALPDLSSRFFGAFGVDAKGIPDSTATASMTESLGDGGTLGAERDASRDVRYTAILIARGTDALDYGMSWLDASLRPGACGQHSTECGLTDLEFWADCPPARAEGQPDEEYAAALMPYRRFLHDVGRISGPTVKQEIESGPFVGYVVEFVIAAERPWVWSATQDIDLPPSVPVIVQDIVYNLAPYPSAELSEGTVVVATNYSTNPSLETNATGWARNVDAGGITVAMVPLGTRVVGELSAVGTASFRTVFTATGASAVPGSWSHDQEVALGAPAGSRYSVNIWSAASVASGAPVITSVNVVAYWRSSAGGTVLRQDDLGNIDPNGGAVSAKSILPPAGATHVLIRSRITIASWDAGTIVRFYSDALAVTVP